MQCEHVQLAAQNTFSILRWAPSHEPIDDEELRDLFAAIYHDSDCDGQRSLRNGSHDGWKAITFEGVKLAYAHFFGADPDLPTITKFLMEAADNEVWGILAYEKKQIPA